MLVSEIIFDLRKKFPTSPLEAWEPEYRTALVAHEGERLRDAYAKTMRGWCEGWPPKPGHILNNLPEPAREKTYVEQVSQRDHERLVRQRKRADELLATALHECAGYLDHEWSSHARIHLINVVRRIAHLEETGLTIDAAMAKINGGDRRPACSECRRTRRWKDDEPMLCPQREPDMWLDEHDAAIFAARAESQGRVNPEGKGLKRGDREPPWRLKAQEQLTKLHMRQQSEEDAP